MTETREQWIEREARKARERCGYDDWDSRNELTRDVWRNVVAPYYPEPVADADTLEKLAEIGENAYNADKSNLIDEKWISATKAILWAAKPEPVRAPVDVDGLAKAMCDAANASAPLFHLDWDETLFRDSYRAEARAALTYLNIEPCDKPEYDPADVAFRDALKKSQEIVNNWTPEQRNHNSIGYAGLQDNERAELENLRAECKRLRHEVEVERDRANDLLADRDSVVNIRDKTIKAMREENTKLRVEASEATAKAEHQRQALDANRKSIESRGAEIARLENEVKRLRTQQPEAEALREVFSREECRHFVAEGEPFTVGVRRLATAYQHVLPKLAVLKDRAEKAEADRDRFHEESNKLSNECSDLGDQLAERNQQSETRAVKVRCNLEPEDISNMVNRCYADGYNQLATCKKVMDHVLLNAVLDVPPGVPTYRELREIGVNAYLSHDSAKRENAGCMVDPMGSAAAAIRDAVLAGIQRREWSDAEVDELRAKLDQVRSEIGCARGQRTTQYCAEVVEYKRRLDAVVAMLEPGKCSCNCVGELGPKCECSNTGNMRDVEAWWTTYCLHARAVALAEGR